MVFLKRWLLKQVPSHKKYAFILTIHLATYSSYCSPMYNILIYITATVSESVLPESTSTPMPTVNSLAEDSLPTSPMLSSPPLNEDIMQETSAAFDDALDQTSSTHTCSSEPRKPVYSKPESLQKIFNGSNISICGFNCMVMKFANNHNLTFSAISELLEMFSIICPKPNEIPTSIFKLKSFFNQFDNNSSNKIFCANCKVYEEDGTCSCAKPNKGHMVFASVEKPLQAIISGKCNCQFWVVHDL